MLEPCRAFCLNLVDVPNIVPRKKFWRYSWTSNFAVIHLLSESPEAVGAEGVATPCAF
jgi:hypothetical protein